MRNRVRPAALSLLATVLVLLAGCYPSENAIWTPKTLVYLPELLGTYQDESPATQKSTTTLEMGEAEKSYHLVTHNAKGEKTGEATLRLVKLGDDLFYDYELPAPKPDKSKPAPAERAPKVFHVFGRLTIRDKKVTLYHFGDQVHVEEELKWKTVQVGDGEARVIANTTEELQAFLRANASKMTVAGSSCTKLHD